MAGGTPIWWIHSTSGTTHDAAAETLPIPGLNDLLRRIQKGDQETLLLLFLLVLLWQENADKKLLLALAYILM